MNCFLHGFVMTALLAFGAAVRADTTATFILPSGVRVQIVEAPFDAAKFKIQGCDSAPEGEPGCLINGRIPFGNAVGLPKTYVKSIRTSFRQRSHFLNVSQMYNAWGNRPLEVTGTIRYFGGNCDDAKNCIFRGLFADGGGAFVAEWLIRNGISTRTVLTDSDDVVDFFMSNIDPRKID